MKEQKLKELYEECLENMKKIVDPIPKTVMGDGNINAQIVMVGEAPGAKEEEQGKPFVGQAGKNLNHFLEVIGLKREDLYITNVVKYRPYRISKKTENKVNRPPNKSEINFFIPYLQKELEILDPPLIVTLGNTALRAVLMNLKLNIGEVHGNSLQHQGQGKVYEVFPLYHPASIIYRRDLAETYEQDLMKLKDLISLESL